MRRKLAIESSALTSGAAVDDPKLRAGASSEDDVSDLDHIAAEKLNTGTDGDHYGHDRAPLHGAEVHEHSGHDAYGHDRASMHGSEVHEIHPEHITLEEMTEALESHCLSVEEAADVVTALQELGQVVAAEGELSLASARILGIATESLLGELGDATSEPLPALEAFSSDARSATQVALEGIGAAVHKAWAAIVAAIKRAVVWFKAICRRLFDQAPRLKKDAEQLAKRVGDLQGTPTVQTFHNQQLALALQVGKKVDAHTIVEGAQSTPEMLKAYFDRLLASDLYSGAAIESLKNGSVSYVPEERIKQLKLVGNGSVGRLNRALGKADLQGEQWYSEEMLGGRAVVCELHPKETVNYEQAIRYHTSTPHLGYAEDSYAGEAERVKLAESLAVAAPADMQAALQGVEQLCDIVLGFRKVQDRLEHLADQCVAQAQEIEHKWGSAEQHGKEGDADGEGGRRPHDALLSAQRFFYSAAPRMFVQEPAQMVSYALRCAHSLNAWVQASMKFYKVEAAEPAKAA